MMCTKYFQTRFLLACLGLFCVLPVQAFIQRRPRCYIIFVLDSCGYHYFQKLDQYLTKGIRTLLNNGIVFTDAQWPYSVPSTAPGHTGLNTGAFAKDHGVTCNAWFDRAGNRIAFDDDSAESSAVFGPTGLYPYGKSAHNVMTCGLSDLFEKQSQPDARNVAFSISLKPRAAIGVGGKAIWFDDQTGNFTSSKAYFDELPDWLVEFNHRASVGDLNEFTWDLRYHKNSPAYRFANLDNYDRASEGGTIIGKKLYVDHAAKEPYEMFQRTPQASRLLFDLAKACVDANLSDNRADRLLLWICISPLDKVGHVFGPESKEAVDMMYHIDNQIRNFMRFMRKKCNRLETLYVLTADHGMLYIPEHLQAQRYTNARRIDASVLAVELASLLKDTFGLETPVRIKAPFVYLGDAFHRLEKERQREVLCACKDFFESRPGIKKAWTNHELDRLNLGLDQIDSYYVMQRFAGRSGDLIIQGYPMSQFTKYQTGTSHEAPYEWNTHVPLIVYQRGSLEKKIVSQRVWPIQLAGTLAEIMCIPRPTSCVSALLPGVFDPVDSYI